MHWERTVRRQVRRSTDIIGVTILASLAINYLLYPLMWLLPDFAEGTVGRELTDAVLYVIVFAIPFAVGTRLSGMTMQELVGEKRPAPEIYLMTIGLVLGWSVLAGSMGAGIEEILNQFGLTEITEEYQLPSGPAALAVQFVATAVIPPIVEELCYRGFYLRTAERSMGSWAAIALTSVAFWLAHYSIEIMPLAVGFGVIGGYIRERYGSLLPSMCAHFAVNTVYLLVNISFAAGGDTIGTVLSTGIYLLEMLLGAIGVVLFVRRGCLKEIWHGIFGNPADVPVRQMVFAVLTSVPALLVLLLSVYFTAGNLEVLPLP
ncbi:MAG: CPBP family intramembrane metalloprotease [Clostridiales bacterium]|nr:CPBP family intramembrane metalloprotease [Clostridiales bacterium]